MKHIYITGLGLLMTLLAGSCDDFLEHDPYGVPTVDNFWKTADDVKSALDAFYDYTNYEGVCGRGVFYYENCSDDMFTGRPQAPSDAYTCENFTMGAVNDLDVNSTWPVMYRMINKANDILRHVPGMDIPETVKNNAIGQARFFRAYAYLWLAPWYGDNGINGGIPIVTEDTPTDDMDVPRPPTILDNYNMIIADMRDAARRLPLLSKMAESDYGRPYKTAAWAFAARAALYAAQYADNSKAAEKHSSLDYHNMVIELCDSIINLTGADKRELHYAAAGSPHTNFADLFRWENNFSKEYIYSILGNETAGPKFHGMFFQAGGWDLYNTWGYFMPTVDLYKAYESENDEMRRKATILAAGESIKFIGVDIHYGVDPKYPVFSESNMTNRKFMSIFEDADCVGKYVNVSGNNQSNRLAVHIMRYADILLMKAEALIWTTGEGNASAKALIDQVRKRAGLAENSPATKEALKKERRLEFAFEFFPSRHLDLVRWGDARATYANPTEGFLVSLNGTNATLTVNPEPVRNPRTFNPNKHHVFPIPDAEIRKSKNLKQNEGY